MTARSAMAPYPILRYGQTASMGRALSGLIRELTRRSSRRRIENRAGRHRPSPTTVKGAQNKGCAE